MSGTFRNRDEQVSEIHEATSQQVCSGRSDYPEDVYRTYLNRQMAEAEARGAAEERAKGVDGGKIIGWVDPKAPAWRNIGFGDQFVGKASRVRTEVFSVPILLGPANVAALEEKTERLFQHVKRGTEYRLIGRGKIQQNGPSDMAEVVIYQDVNDGSFWVRSPSEFYDGRFKAIFDARAALTREGGV